MRGRLMRFMAGRYGPDQLYTALFILTILLWVVGTICGGIVGMAFRIVGYLCVFFAVFRFLSRNIQKRRKENDRFLRYWWPVRTKITGKLQQIRFCRTHRFFKCPGCKNTLRVPKGKGKIEITCPRCGERFRRKT